VHVCARAHARACARACVCNPGPTEGGAGRGVDFVVVVAARDEQGGQGQKWGQ
jgi:hypothetical protein